MVHSLFCWKNYCSDYKAACRLLLKSMTNSRFIKIVFFMVEPHRLFLLMFLIFLPVVVWREFQMMEAWTATIYPNRNDPSVSERIGAIGEHPSLEECRRVTTDRIAEEGWVSADYECGRRCEILFPILGDSTLLCDETMATLITEQ